MGIFDKAKEMAEDHVDEIADKVEELSGGKISSEQVEDMAAKAGFDYDDAA